ncbi:ATP/GTP-binding protein [Candidatus Venteria ishoeyi]|uniref:GTP-binding protein n=1 Tax=Candidatus Venteria ishoeyi TaxID=1899563 RepID=UPI0025A57A04|nr:ATP/GTP-binding protein [Candidatus Venteria ishoeyi]MDM8545045.1 ATP/GTP-binding protein [Candidatus Venteria ishoeyi]
MADYKIIFTGPSGAGKTTAITALSDIATIRTDAASNEILDSYIGKKGITVAMDYGLMKLGNRDKIHLYGTPGQERFDFMWEILIKGGLGLILLIDHAHRYPIREMKAFLHAFRDFLKEGKLVIGITRMDVKPEPGLELYYEHFRALNINPPIFEIDARNKQDVSLLVQALLYSLDPGIT